jgi:hypothetical protein
MEMEMEHVSTKNLTWNRSNNNNSLVHFVGDGQAESPHVTNSS